MTIGLLALSAAEIDGLYFWKNGSYTRFDVSDIVLENDQVSVGNAVFSVSDVDSITFRKPAEVEVVADTLYIYNNGATATVTPENVKGITTEANGAAVSITNSNTDREMCFVLSGESDEGSFTYNGEYKACIRLAGVNLKSTTGAALDIKCGKRIALELLDGTVNYLEDATTDLEQKAALYCKGHMEVSGGGELSVKSNVTHAIKTKEYMLVKKTTGGITVTGAGGDGIHAGQYFKMNGGSVTVSGVKGDGIQAEATQEDDEYDGQVILRGGTLNVSVTERDVAAIKSDSLMSISGGTITISSTGAAAKGISCDKVLTTTAGSLTITNSGMGVGTSSSYSTAKGLTSDGSIDLQGGTITIKMTGAGGKGIKSDGTLVIGKSDEEGPVLNVSTTGAKYQSASSAKAIKAVGTITINGGETTVNTSTQGAEGLESKLKANNSIVFKGGKHYFKCYDDCINSAGAIVFDGGVTVCYGYGNDAIDSNYGQAGAITIGDGAVLSYTTKGNPEEGFDCDNNSYIKITGNGIGISAGGSQGGGGGFPGGGGSSSSIGSAVQGYYLSTSSISYATNRYYSLADSSGKNLVTYSFEASVSSTLSLFTATGTASVTSFTAQ